MVIHAVVTDFDNTITEERGLEPFFEAYAGEFCKVMNLQRGDYETALEEVKRDIGEQPLRYGWRSNGFFSAPVQGDPIGTNTVAHIEILERIRRGEIQGISVHVPKSESEVLEIKEKCYLHAYPQRETFFREGAGEYLNTLEKLFPGRVAIVSNSRDTSIRRKLEKIPGLVTSPRIIGLAQKMLVHSKRGQFQPQGFPTSVNPDRPEYLRLLREFHSNLSELVVVGDNFYLDLSAILHSGGYGILLDTEVTQGYEIPFLQQHPRGHFARGYDAVIEFLRSNCA
ncbi:HAD family hydrolase [Candidatus Woesearchaeota archaeon]|nr:HAD family hydrolase [Candidatus Woesearchaeota archaeon]